MSSIFPQVWSSPWRALIWTGQTNLFLIAKVKCLKDWSVFLVTHSTRTWVVGICTFFAGVNSPLQCGWTAPMYLCGGLCPWLLPWGWYSEVVVSPLQVLSTEVTLLIEGHYFCLLQDTSIRFVCLCTFCQPRSRSDVTCNCHCLGKTEHGISENLAFVIFPTQINELWRNTAFDVCTNGNKLSAILNSKNS